MWNKTSHDFGEVIYSDTPEISTVFIYDGEEPIVDFSPSCLCLQVTQVHNVIHVAWKLKQPPALGYISRKYVTVHFSNGDEDEIKLTAIIKP